MRIVTEKDTIERTDSSGDKLILREAPWQSDVTACNKIEVDEAAKAMKGIEVAGVDAAAVMKEISETPELLKMAEEMAEENDTSPEVNRFRLRSLAVKLIISGAAIGGEAIMDSYDHMDPTSAGWVDAQVKEVWEAAIPSEAEKNRQGADDKMPECTTIGATPELPQSAPENS